MKKNKGVLTIEASLVLTFSIMFMLFFLSFGRVYRAQNIVSHGVLQAADAISTESYIRENVSEEDLSEFLYVSNHIYGGESISGEALKSLKKVNFKKLAKDKFTAVVAEDTGKADEVLNSVGVKDGLSGVDFSRSKLDEKTGESIVFANYTVKLQFPLFGVKEIKMTKAAKVRNMGAESYLIEVRSANKAQGSTSGNTKVRKNGSTVISANPEWGYRFVRWQDGNTQNPRTISNVNGDKTFVAYFAKQGYGVKVNVKPSGAGSVAGVGTYELNDVVTLMPKENEGYLFSHWEDNNSTSKSRQVRVENDVTLTAVFKLAPSIKIKNGSSESGFVNDLFYETSSQYSSFQGTVDKANSYKNSITLNLEVKGTGGAPIKWSSSNTNVATVNNSGVVTAVGPGSATITASVTVDGKTYSKSATVNCGMFLQHYYLRKKGYSNKLYEYGRWLGDWNGNWNYNGHQYYSVPGWFYRCVVVQNPGGNIVAPGGTTKGKSTVATTTPGNNRIMHGTNDTGRAGYVIWVDNHFGWHAGHGDYVFIPRSGNPYVIQELKLN